MKHAHGDWHISPFMDQVSNTTVLERAIFITKVTPSWNTIVHALFRLVLARNVDH